MLLVTFLTKDFILKSLKKDVDSLNMFLSTVFINKEHLMVFYSPKLDIKKLLDELQYNRSISGTKVKAWLAVLKILFHKKRLVKQIDPNFLESCKPLNNLISDTNLSQSLRRRVYSFSHKDHKIKDILYDIPIFGKTDDFAINKIDEFFKLAKKSKFLKFEDDFVLTRAKKVQIFYEYLASFFCFFDTFVIWDKYIIDRKRGGLLTSELASGFDNLRNFVIVTDNPFIDPKRTSFFGGDSKKKLSNNKIKDNLFSWYSQIKNNLNSNVSLTFLLANPNKMKTIHSRFYAWASMKESYFDSFTINDLKNNVHMAIRSDKGDEPFDIDFHKECLLTCESISVDDFKTALNIISSNSSLIVNDNYFKMINYPI